MSQSKYSSAKLILDDQEIELPLVEGNDGRQAVKVEDLHNKTGVHLFDPGLRNTAAVQSPVTWIDAAGGHLLYRGYDVEQLVENSTYVETAYLLINGELPTPDQLKQYSDSLSKHSLIHESMKNFFDAFPGDVHPIGILSTMTTALSSYYPGSYDEQLKLGVDIKTRLISKIRTLAAWSYKKSIGQPIVYPRDALPYVNNFLNMLFAIPAEPYSAPEADAKILNQILILYADHEQNVATTTMRLVASTEANLFACISAAMCAMWGSRDATENIPPMRMLEDMVDHNELPERYFEPFIQGRDKLRTNAFGHTSYEVKDPRAIVSHRLFHEYLKANDHLNADPIIRKALEIEEFVGGHPYFVDRNLYPNLDFYSSLIFHCIGLPRVMFNVTRIIGKTVGWLAHWQHLYDSTPITFRPAQIYTGSMQRDYVPLNQRG
jgi:citrate synthase